MMPDLNDDIKNKLDQLTEWFFSRKGSIVAFSGGIDSSLVLFIARRVQGRERTIGVIADSASLKRKDLLLAESFCRSYDIILEVIKTEELKDENYNSNPENRCYFCKDHLFRDMQPLKDKYPGYDILVGTNHDDRGDYRPGLRAAAAYGALAPLADCLLTKDDIRLLGRYFDLPNRDKPASPCLSSRIPYNRPVTAVKLRQIEAAEEALNELGFSEVRVRHYDAYALVEVPHGEIPELLSMGNTVVERIKAVGFDEVRIDQEGLVSGKLNRQLGTRFGNVQP